MTTSKTTTTAPHETHVKALESSVQALSQIRNQLAPFVRQLESDDTAKKAQAQAVVALSIGTLRYMGARLEGRNEGRSKDDPLRQELDQMRKVLVNVEKKRKREEEEEEGKNKKKEKIKGNSASEKDSKSMKTMTTTNDAVPSSSRTKEKERESSSVKRVSDKAK